MHPDLTTLVKVFSEHELIELNDGGHLLANAFGEPDYDRLLARESFPARQEMVKSLRQDLDRIRGPAGKVAPVADQVARSLQLLDETRQETNAGESGPREKLEVLQDLIKRLLYPGWTQPEKESYDLKREIIVEWTDYFISYTNRDAGSTNLAFRGLIKRSLGYTPKEQAALRDNYVARSMVHLFKKRVLFGFFDQDDIKIGEKIGEKIREYCQRTFAFVQLVEDMALSPPDTPPNWCFFEFSEFTKSDKVHQALGRQPTRPRLFFLTTDENEKKHITPEHYRRLPTYGPWFKEIEARRFFSLQVTDAERNTKVQELAKSVAELRQEILDEILV
jgi:hypothetical protein